MGTLREPDTAQFVLLAVAALGVGVASAFAPIAMVVAGAIGALAVGMARAPAATVAALIALLPFTVALNPWPGVDLAASRVAIPVVAALVVWRYRGWHTVKRSAVLVILAAFFGWVALSVLWAEGSTAWALRKAAVWFTLWPFAFVVAVAAGGSNEMRERFARAIGVAGVGAALAGFVFWLGMASGAMRVAAWRDAILPVFAGARTAETAGQFSSWYVNIGGATVVRVLSVFPDPHTLGAVLVLALPFAVFASRTRRWWRVGVAVIVAAALLTFSRSAYLGLVVAGAVMAIAERRMRRPALFGAALLIAGIVAVTPVGARFVDAFRLDEGSNVARSALWRAGLASAFTHPLGVGIGNAPLAAPPQDLPTGTALTERTPVSFHNTYLDLAAELGVVGLVLWLLLLGVAVAACWRNVRAAPAAAAAIASLAGFATVSIFDSVVYSPVAAPLAAAVLGFAAGCTLRELGSLHQTGKPSRYANIPSSSASLAEHSRR